MKKIFLTTVSVLSVMCITLQCTKDYGSRLDKVEDKLNTIGTADEQIASIRSSIKALSDADVTINKNLTDLENTTATVNNFVSSVKNALDGYPIDNYKDRLNAVDAWLITVDGEIKGMNSADAAIQKRIDDLNTALTGYADRNWANNTFVTLAEQEKTSKLIEDLSGKLPGMQNTIETYRDKLNMLLQDPSIQEYIKHGDDVVRSEIVAVSGRLDTVKINLGILRDEKLPQIAVDVKEWVCGELSAYYTMGEVDSKMDSLASALKTALADTAESHKALFQVRKDTLDALVNAREAAKVRLTEEYKQAIVDAVANFGTLIDANKANISDLNTRVEGLRENVDSLMADVARLKTDIESMKNRIQSLKFIPEYQGGIAAIDTTASSFTLDFLVTPAAMVDSLATDNTRLYVKSVTLLKGTAAVELTPTAISGDASTGIASVTFNRSDLAFSSEEGLCACLKVDTGNTAITSEFFDVVKKK